MEDGKLFMMVEVVQVDNKVYLYNGDGSEFSKVKDGFDYIDISNKNAFGAVSNNKLKVFDYDGNLLSTDSITLVSPRAFKLSANESGVEVKIYDADGNVKQTINYNINKNKEVEKENEE